MVGQYLILTLSLGDIWAVSKYGGIAAFSKRKENLLKNIYAEWIREVYLLRHVKQEEANRT